LRDLQRINRFLGGIRTYRKLLEQAAPDRTAPLRVVDLGAGTADCLESLTDYPKLTPVAVDFNVIHLLYQRAGSRVHRVVADAMQLPFRDDAVDFVTSAHFLHHFSPEQNVAILSDALRAARRGVIVNDTRRHRLPLLFVQLLCVLRLFGRITRYDAPASIRRGYNDVEAREIGQKVAPSSVDTVRIWPFRFGLFLWK
jgi:ubiquinone/menaquinone biosynthesis C-methylase UbiE